MGNPSNDDEEIGEACPISIQDSSQLRKESHDIGTGTRSSCMGDPGMSTVLACNRFHNDHGPPADIKGGQLLLENAHVTKSGTVADALTAIRRPNHVDP